MFTGRNLRKPICGWEKSLWLPCVNHNSQHYSLVGKRYLCREKSPTQKATKDKWKPCKGKSHQQTPFSWRMRILGIFFMNGMSKNELTQGEYSITNGEKERTRKEPRTQWKQNPDYLLAMGSWYLIAIPAYWKKYLSRIIWWFLFNKFPANMFTW